MSVACVLRDGLWHRNAALVQMLGLCPLLAVTTTAVNGIALGVATGLALLVSSCAVAALRHLIVREVRLPVYVLILASAVTVVDMALEAWSYHLHARLGLFIPLIVTNCAVLARAEAFASRHGVGAAALDALAVGAGFAMALVTLGGLRELLGTGGLLQGAELLFGSGAAAWGLQLFPVSSGFTLAVLPPGAFLALALLAALRNLLAGRPATGVNAAPAGGDAMSRSDRSEETTRQ